MSKKVIKLMQKSGHSLEEVSWYANVPVEELELCIAGMYELSEDQICRILAYLSRP